MKKFYALAEAFPQWLGDYAAVRRNNADPMVLLPWRVRSALLERVWQ
jgi:hypothetical protein